MSGVKARLDRLVADLVEQAGPGTRGGTPVVSVWLGDLDGAVHLERDADVPHYAASTMKLPLLVAAHRRHERGELDLDQPVLVHNRFASAADGSPFSLDQADDQDDETWDALGAERPLRTLIEHMTVKSGNLATNLVLERVGAGAVADVLTDAGASGSTVLPRGIEDAVAREAGLDNLVTAEDLGRVLRGVRPDVEAVLARQEHRGSIPAGLPDGTYVANKTGWVDGVTHDAALVRPPDRPAYVLVVLTTVDVPEEVAVGFIADVSRVVWEDWGGTDR
jgi:beta-lactamase class A